MVTSIFIELEIVPPPALFPVAVTVAVAVPGVEPVITRVPPFSGISAVIPDDVATKYFIPVTLLLFAVIIDVPVEPGVRVKEVVLAEIESEDTDTTGNVAPTS